MAYNQASDIYAQRSTEVISQARNAALLVPSDIADLTPYAKGLLVTATGTLTVLPILAYAGGSTTPVSLGTIAAGTFVPVQVARVFATGTSATVVGLFN